MTPQLEQLLKVVQKYKPKIEELAPNTPTIAYYRKITLQYDEKGGTNREFYLLNKQEYQEFKVRRLE